jgi:hypothetical protein
MSVDAPTAAKVAVIDMERIWSAQDCYISGKLIGAGMEFTPTRTELALLLQGNFASSVTARLSIAY